MKINLYSFCFTALVVVLGGNVKRNIKMFTGEVL